MARTKTKDTEQSTQDVATAIAENVSDAIGKPDAVGFASAIPKKTYERLANPFDFESAAAGNNRVRLLKSESEEQRRQGKGAWVIRFAYNPNEDTGANGEKYNKENPHPVLTMLKDADYQWGFDADGKGGWGKPFGEDSYGRDHLESRKVLQKAVQLIGGTTEPERSL